MPRAFVSTTLSACLLSPGLPPPLAVALRRTFSPHPPLGGAPPTPGNGISASPASGSHPPPTHGRRHRHRHCGPTPSYPPTAHGLILPRSKQHLCILARPPSSLGDQINQGNQGLGRREEGNVSNRRHDVARAARGRQTSVEAVGTGQACSVRGARTRTRAAARWQKKPKSARTHARTPRKVAFPLGWCCCDLRRRRFSRRRRSVISGTGRGA